MARIALVIQDLPGGGAERVVLRIAEALSARGHKVDLVLFFPVCDYAPEVPSAARLFVLCKRSLWRRRIKADMPVHAVWRGSRVCVLRLLPLAISLCRQFGREARLLLRRADLRRALRLCRYTEDERPDIVLTNLPLSDYAACLAAHLCRSMPPVAMVLHNVERPEEKYARRRRLLFPANGCAVAVSQGTAKNASIALGLSTERIATIHNPAFTSDIVRRAKDEPDHPWFRDEGPPVVLSVGRLAPQKDFLTLLEAFHHVLTQRACRLVILGKGPLRIELEERVRVLGLHDCVSLPGWVENPWAFMSRAILFVLSSRHEGFGNVLVEALACGCPVVSTDCPSGPAEILEDPSLLAPVGNPEALAQVMLRALDRPVDKAALRAKAERFSVEQAVDSYEKLIVDVLTIGSHQ